MGDPVWISAIAAVVSAFAAMGALAFSVYARLSAKESAAHAADLETQNRQLRGDWIPMHRALRYLALESDWSRKAEEQDSQSLENRLGREFIEALSRGEVGARGRALVSDVPYKLAAASTPIPLEFWQYAFLQPFGEIVLNDEARNVAATSGEFQVPHRQHFREIRVRRSDIHSLWPRTAKRRILTSPYFKPLKAYWRNGGSHVDQRRDFETRQRILQNIRTDC